MTVYLLPEEFEQWAEGRKQFCGWSISTRYAAKTGLLMGQAISRKGGALEL